MGKSLSKYKSKSPALENLGSEVKSEEDEPSPSTSASVSNLKPESPVDATNISISGNTEGRHYVIILKAIYTKWGCFKALIKFYIMMTRNIIWGM